MSKMWFFFCVAKECSTRQEVSSVPSSLQTLLGTVMAWGFAFQTQLPGSLIPRGLDGSGLSSWT